MQAQTSGSRPILCAHLLRQVDGRLLELLRSLAKADWGVETIVPGWAVRDVAAHLLDTALRKLSLVRDACRVESPELRSAKDVVEFVNRLNREGVAVYRRLSPPVLIDMMDLACRQSALFHESLDPFAPSMFPVSWAGEELSLNWFDTARELTERWHHQQQIRLAVDKPGIMTPDLYHPVLDCFLRGLPYLYRNIESPAGTVIEVEITGECGGRWFLSRRSTGWELAERAPVEANTATAAARVAIPQEIAWRVFTKGIDRESALAHAKIEGQSDLGEAALHLVAIVG